MTGYEDLERRLGYAPGDLHKRALERIAERAGMNRETASAEILAELPQHVDHLDVWAFLDRLAIPAPHDLADRTE